MHLRDKLHQVNSSNTENRESSCEPSLQPGSNLRKGLRILAPGFFWVLISVYCVCLLAAAQSLSLWLDEILDLEIVRQSSVGKILHDVPLNAGGVPLGYLVQSMFIRALGFSTISARLPSILFSLLACWGVHTFAKQCGCRKPILAVLIFATMPLQFRYAVEARPYSQALAISIWETVIFLWLIRDSTLKKAVLYGLSIAAGLYTQPFTAFVVLAHLIWVSGAGLRELRTRRFLLCLGSTAIGGLLFLPWYTHSQAIWSSAIAAANSGSGLSNYTPLMILRELTGGGGI